MPSSRNSRPYVILNAAMSLDGKIATYTGDSRMSSPADLRRVHRLRASVDGIMVGMRTLLRDDPKLTVKFARGRKPHRIIVDRQRTNTAHLVRSQNGRRGSDNRRRNIQSTKEQNRDP